MIAWFIIATVVMLAISIYDIYTDQLVYTGPVLLMIWALFAWLPSMIHTSDTKVYTAKESEYRVYITSPYSALLITDIYDSEPDTKKVNNAYMLMKLGQGEYKVVRHQHYNMWGSECTGPSYFLLAD
jgi:hypothetical protein